MTHKTDNDSRIIYVYLYVKQHQGCNKTETSGIIVHDLFAIGIDTPHSN